MNLIAYSDSESSDNEAPPAPKPAAKPAPKSSFSKVVDRSNPGKIKVKLPGAPQQGDGNAPEERPAKRARTGDGAFSGFNAMLPAPKKPKVDATAAASSLGKKAPGKGLGVGVSLRTGAEPAFKRETKVEEEYDENGDPVKTEPLQKKDFRAMLNLPPPKTEKKAESKPLTPSESVAPEAAVASAPAPAPVLASASASAPATKPKPVAKPKFMPLSVGRGKKKPVVKRPLATSQEESSTSLASAQARQPTEIESKPPPRKKVSLFGISQEAAAPTQSTSTGDYKPLLYGAQNEEEEEDPIADSAFSDQPAPNQPTHIAATQPHDLTNIASELNLSEAERRQLFGGKGQGPDLSGARILDFNTDTEYAHNEKLRQEGESVQHNPLKSIKGTGKNSLRSLVNVAATQKDALEDHFAAGRRNKKEAGSKYGW